MYVFRILIALLMYKHWPAFAIRTLDVNKWRNQQFVPAKISSISITALDITETADVLASKFSMEDNYSRFSKNTYSVGYAQWKGHYNEDV
jgi:hypothetical protein